MPHDSSEADSTDEMDWLWVGDQRTHGVPRRSVMKAAGAAGAASLLPFSGVGAATSQSSNDGHGRNPKQDRRSRKDGSPLPGPPVLYEPLADAPQLENTDPWEADPLMVSGTDAYVDGEYLFQDFIYDDYGATTATTPTPPAPHPDSHDFSPMTGDVVSPTDPIYANNAADLLEFRTQLTDQGIAYRITLNTMKAPDLAGIAIGINTDPEGITTSRTDWGYSLGDLGAPADHVLVMWGTGAELDGEPLPDDRYSVDVDSNQLHVQIPLDPDGATWRHHLVVGLFDTATREFKQIQEQPDETHPGGAHGKNPPPVLNVGFRYYDQEPLGGANVEPGQAGREFDQTIRERTGSRGVGYGHWREDAQARALSERDIGGFHADIDFGELRAGTTEKNIPKPVTSTACTLPTPISARALAPIRPNPETTTTARTSSAGSSSRTRSTFPRAMREGRPRLPSTSTFTRCRVGTTSMHPSRRISSGRSVRSAGKSL